MIEASTPEQAYGGFLAMNVTFFAVGVAGTFWAHKLKDPRVELLANVSLRRWADSLIGAVRFLSLAVLLISLYLFFRLMQMYPTIAKAA